jgi:hypothetical protein
MNLSEVALRDLFHGATIIEKVEMEEDDGFQPLFDYSKVYDSPPKFQEDDSDEEEVIISTQQRYGATKRCAGNMLTKVDYNTSC